MTRKLAGIGAVVMTTLLALLVLWQFRIVIIYVLISLTLAATLRPLVNRLAGRGFVVRVVWILIYLVIFGSFCFVIFLASRTTIDEIQRLTGSMAELDAWSLPVWLEGSSFQKALIPRLPLPSELFEAVTGTQGQLVMPALLDFTQGIGGVLSGLLIITFLSIYWILNQIHFERLWLSLLPSGQRTQARGIWRTIELETGAYIRSQFIQSLLAGVLLILGYWLIGSPYPVFLGLAGALACLIPVVGTALAVIPPILVGLLTSLQLSLFTFLYALVVLIVLGAWVKPRLFSRRWDNPILTVVLLIALADAFGIVGIMVAPPLSVVCQILWSQLISHRLASGAAAQVSDLKERLARVKDIISGMAEPRLPLVTSSMERITQLIEKAEPILQANFPPAALPADHSEQSLTITPQPEQESTNDRT